MNLPTLAELKCNRIHFDPGDRVLVRVFQPLSKEQTIALRRSVEKWAGDAVEVLIVDTSKMEVEIERRGIVRRL